MDIYVQIGNSALLLDEAVVKRSGYLEQLSNRAGSDDHQITISLDEFPIEQWQILVDIETGQDMLENHQESLREFVRLVSYLHMTEDSLCVIQFAALVDELTEARRKKPDRKRKRSTSPA